MFFWNAIFGVQKTNALIKCLNRSDLLYSSADTHRLAARISVAYFSASQLLTVKLLKIGNMSNMGGSLSSWLWPDLFGLSIHSMVINNIWINNQYIFYTESLTCSISLCKCERRPQIIFLVMIFSLGFFEVFLQHTSVEKYHSPLKVPTTTKKN